MFSTFTVRIRNFHIMKNILVFYVVLMLSLHAWSNDKPTLIVAGEEWQGTAHSDGTGTYFEIVKAVFGDSYNIEFRTAAWVRSDNLFKTGKASILVGVYGESEHNYLLPKQHLDVEYSVYLLYDSSKHTFNSIEDLAGYSIAGRKGYGFESFLPKSSNFLGVDAIHNLDKLVLHGRIDGILSYSYNVHLADTKNRLAHSEIIPPKKIYLAFNNTKQGKQLAGLYDQKIAELIKQDKLRQYFHSEQEYQHANFALPITSINIDWISIPKSLDKATGNLTLLARELLMNDLLQQHMPNYSLTHHSLSAINALHRLQQNQTTCVIGILKNDKREKYAYFSNPSYVYLPPRLVGLTDNLEQFIASYVNTTSIKQLITENPNLRIGINKQLSVNKALISALTSAQKQNIMIFDNSSYDNILLLLTEHKIDATIIWPSIIPSIKRNIVDLTKLRSVTISESIGKEVYSHIACSKGPEGKQIIDSINSILANKTLMTPYYQKVSSQLDKDSAELFIKHLKH